MRGQFADGMTHDVQRLLWLYLEHDSCGYQVIFQAWFAALLGFAFGPKVCLFILF